MSDKTPPRSSGWFPRLRATVTRGDSVVVQKRWNHRGKPGGEYFVGHVIYQRRFF